MTPYSKWFARFIASHEYMRTYQWYLNVAYNAGVRAERARFARDGLHVPKSRRSRRTTK